MTRATVYRVGCKLLLHLLPFLRHLVMVVMMMIYIEIQSQSLRSTWRLSRSSTATEFFKVPRASDEVSATAPFLLK